jgi:hypothetical protein
MQLDNLLKPQIVYPIAASCLALLSLRDCRDRQGLISHNTQIPGVTYTRKENQSLHDTTGFEVTFRFENPGKYTLTAHGVSTNPWNYFTEFPEKTQNQTVFSSTNKDQDISIWCEGRFVGVSIDKIEDSETN